MDSDDDTPWTHDGFDELQREELGFDDAATPALGGRGRGGATASVTASSRGLVENLHYGECCVVCACLLTLMLMHVHRTTDVTEADLKELMGSFGPVLKVKMLFDKSGRSEGSATVLFKTRAGAAKAVEECHGRTLDGQPMQLSFAPEPRAAGGRAAGRLAGRLGPAPGGGGGGGGAAARFFGDDDDNNDFNDDGNSGAPVFTVSLKDVGGGRNNNNNNNNNFSRRNNRNYDNNNNNNNNNSNNNSRSQIECYNCGAFGHVKRECRQNSNDGGGFSNNRNNRRGGNGARARGGNGRGRGGGGGGGRPRNDATPVDASALDAELDAYMKK